MVVIRLHQRFCRPWMLPIAWTGFVLCGVGMIYLVWR